MTTKKGTRGGGKEKIRNIQSLDDWGNVTTNEVLFDLPDGSKDRYIIHALTGPQMSALVSAQELSKPKAPEQIRDAEGKVKRDPHYDERMDKYRIALQSWNQLNVYWYVLEGWAKPNKIDVPGATDVEKVKYLYDHSGVAGYAAQLAMEIQILSQLAPRDVDFFTDSSALGR